MDRPKLTEDEDDLLKFQKEFLASKSAPAASVVRKGDKRRSDNPPRDVVHMDTLPPSAPSLDPQPPKKSRFRASRDKEAEVMEAKTMSSNLQRKTDFPDLDPEELIDKQDKGLATVLSSIIERDTRNSAFTMPQRATQPFPSVAKISSFAKEAGKHKTKSLFAQQIERQGLQNFGVMVQQEASKMGVSDASSSVSAEQGSLPDRFQKDTHSHIVDGRGLSASRPGEEAQSIHKENLTKLSEMSEEEILAEQRQLLQMLDPSLVAYLKSKSQSTSTTVNESKPKLLQKKPKTDPQKTVENENDLPDDVPMEGKEKWVHMDKVEYDKLEWMKDLPPPSADDTKTGQQARFDFHGNVVPTDADIPVTEGLHHHGEEPQRAGYSIGELFQLARSTNIQQRVLALSTLGNIIQKAKDGALDDFIQTPILPSILDSGVVFLIRWACDDSVDAVVAAALSALCALLCNPADEAALDMVLPWYQGPLVPALIPAATVQLLQQDKTEQDEDNKAEETDADVAKRDLIQGLVTRMMLIERIFYILESRQPQAPTVASALHILSRLARHSSQLAYEIARNAKLMELIFSQFLPTAWKAQDEQKTVSIVYGRPVAAAMRLVGSLCQAGRHIASTLMSSYPLGNVLLRYLAVGPDELQLSAMEAESLQQESYATWRILLSYGLAGDVYMEMYQSVMSHLQEVVSRASDLSRQQPTRKDVGLVSVLEAVLPLAAINPLKPGFKQGEMVMTQAPVTSSASWSCVEGMLGPLRLCTERCLNHLGQTYMQQKGDLQFPAACLNFLATYYSKRNSQSRGCAVDVVQQVEQFCTSTLHPFLKSWGFSSILSNLSSSSNILAAAESKRREVCRCLPELGCDGCKSGIPVVSTTSTVGFLLALTRLVYTLCRVHKGVIEQTAQVIISHEDLNSYLRKITTCPNNHLHNNHFTQFENLLHYFIIKLAVLARPVSQHLPTVHQLALDVMSRLQEGDEFIAHDLMSIVLFNAIFIPEGQEEELAAASMAEMKISETHFLKSATQEEITTNNCQLLRLGFKNLNVIRSHYFTAFAHMEHNVAKSRSWFQQMPQEVNSLQSGHVESYLMPADWVFLPLVELYNLSGAMGSSAQSRQPGSPVAMVMSVVQWIFMLESWRSRTLASVSVTLKISRVMCIFLAGNDLFLERCIYPYLASLFRCYTTARLLSKMDFDEPVPGISSFYDLYMLFLDQYEAVSFGDPVFGAFVLLPMQQNQNVLLRRAVWQERAHLLRTLTLPVTEMLISIDRYLTPDETDVQLVQLYAGSLLSSTVRQRWSPVLFLVALHHLNRFLYYTADSANNQVRHRLWEKVLQCRDESVREMIVQFKQVSPQAPTAMELYAELPANRQNVLDHHRQTLGV